ncbi:MAG: hypothetical protein ABR512_02055 [Desulfopila sp.]
MGAPRTYLQTTNRKEGKNMGLWQRIKHINLINLINLITVGTKVLCGVALATNIFIGTLVYFNMHGNMNRGITISSPSSAENRQSHEDPTPS